MIEIDLDDRQIGFLVHANQLGIMSRRSRIFILQLYPNAIRLLDHVTIGDDVALGVNDYARTERSLTDGPGIRTALTWLASEELVEEILERRITAFVTAILTETSSYAGVGFAMPSNTVIQVYNQLIGPEHRVARGSIGIEFSAQPNPAIAHIYGSGVTVSNVISGSPADEAGLKIGDTITAVDGRDVKTGDDLVADIASRKPGSKAKLAFVRNGKKQEATVTIADRSKLFASRLGEEDENQGEETPKASKFGVTVRGITPDLADRLGIAAGKGVVVQDVKQGSFAEDLGLNRGDVILEVNKQSVNNPEDFTKIETAMKSGQDVVFLVRPRGARAQDGTIFLAGTLP